MKLHPNTRTAMTVAAVSALLIVSALAVHHARRKHAQQLREAGYQVTLLSYSEVLKPGTKRKDVESYLTAKNVKITTMGLTDLAKIGQEDAPWYCSENNIYVAFQFTGIPPRPDASDRLRTISIFPWLEGCL